MKLVKVDPRKITVPEVRVTAQFDADLLEQFKASMKEVGQMAPPIVYKVGDDLVLSDGLHRVQEAIENGVTAIDVAVLDGDMVDVLTTNVFVDHLRGKTPASQMVKVIKVLYTEFALDVDKMQERTGLTRDYIEKLIRISEASPAVQDALDQGVIGVGHAFQLARLPYAVQQEELIAKHQVYRFKVTELKGFIDQVLANMEGAITSPVDVSLAEPRSAPVYKCEGCHQEVEPRYLRPVMLCPNCFGNVWELAKFQQATETKESED